ncbi:ATPase [Aureococcus anophagefferens]|nr:ATPase [Aureococcus anophagefferens]
MCKPDMDKQLKPDNKPDMELSVHFRNLSVRFKDVVALAPCSGDVPAGELTALMGPTGCGKTSLLNAIARRGPDDLVFPGLTIRETLVFSARLRLADATLAEKLRQVEECIELLRLSHCADAMVGGGMDAACPAASGSASWPPCSARAWKEVKPKIFQRTSLQLHVGNATIGGLMWFQLGYRESDIWSRYSLAFAVPIAWVFFPLMDSLGFVPTAEIMLRKELSVNSFRLEAWYLIQTTYLLLPMFAQSMIYLIVFFALSGVSTNPLVFVALYAVVVIALLTFKCGNDTDDEGTIYVDSCGGGADRNDGKIAVVEIYKQYELRRFEPAIARRMKSRALSYEEGKGADAEKPPLNARKSVLSRAEPEAVLLADDAESKESA